MSDGTLIVADDEKGIRYLSMPDPEYPIPLPAKGHAGDTAETQSIKFHVRSLFTVDNGDGTEQKFRNAIRVTREAAEKDPASVLRILEDYTIELKTVMWDSIVGVASADED